MVDPQTARPLDAVVIGAGPVGLYQVFQLGLLGLRAAVVDPLPVAGGQCVELYPDKPIYDIPALPVCSGRELTERLLQQVAPFAPDWHLGRTVDRLDTAQGGGYALELSDGTSLSAPLVYIAAGAGAFLARRLAAEGVDDCEGHGLQHVGISPEPNVAGRRVVVIGGGEPAVQTALVLASQPAAQRPSHIALLHRRDQFDAPAASLQALVAHREAGAIDVIVGQVSALARNDAGRLSAIELLGPDGTSRLEPVDVALVRLGLAPKLGPIAGWGAALERKALRVDPARFETSLPGVYAVGDINSYPGKRKLIACGFHEATLAAYAGAERLQQGRPVPLLYTTSSTLLQRRLGVAPEPPEPPAGG